MLWQPWLADNLAMRFRCLLLVCCLVALSRDAAAQIYAWRDANGTLVLSDHTANPSAVTYAVPESRALRTTRPATGRAGRAVYEPLIQTHASAHGLAPDLLRAVIQVESAFNPLARSPKGAMGLMQLMPETAKVLGVVNPWDADQNIRGGAAYLRRLLDRFHQNAELALAAYNAGPDAVGRAKGQVPAIRETREYVRKVARASGQAVGPQAAGGPSQAGQTAGSTVIYRIAEEIDGRQVVRYSTQRPASASYEVVGH